LSQKTDQNKTCILFLIGTLGTGGKERQLIELINGLPEHKYKVVLLTKNITAHYFEKVRHKIILENLDREKFGLNSLLDVIKVIRKHKPAIIQSWATPTSFLAILAKWFTGKKIVILDSSIRHAPEKINWLSDYGAFRLFIQQFSDKVVSNSKAGLAAFKVKPGKAICIYNGFDLKRVENISGEKIKTEFAIDGSCYIVGMVARFDAMKDYMSYVRAATLILEERSDVLFFAVGDGYLLNEIRSGIPDPLKKHFIFTGNRPDVESVISIFDVAVLSTYTEGISNSIIEYMALEKPVIATGGGGTAELIDNGKSGIILQSNTPVLLAKTINELIENRPRRLEIGRNGYLVIRENFSLDRMIHDFEKLYASYNARQ
jgi:glycosyltransferase involved in cell wall biosynthesis